MSHFTVMVIGDEPEKKLAPFQENNMGDCPDEFLQFTEDEDYDVDEKTGKKGYWNNPNSKWDWYSLGGRWSGMIKLKNGANGKAGKGSLVMQNEVGIDQANKKDIENFSELTTFAVIKDGKWYEDAQWASELQKLVMELPDETSISIYDCHKSPC